VSLQGGKSYGEALIEIAHFLHISARAVQTANPTARARQVLNAFQPLADRGLPCLLVLDGFEDVKERAEVSSWHRFLCALPRHVVVLLTSRANPAITAVLEGATCRWYEYSVGKMINADLLKLFKELATVNGLHDRIHLDDLQQQAILQDICTLLDGYPLGAELIFGTAHTIEGKVFTPEAATRSLEEVCAELRETPLAGIWAVLEVAYLRLSPPARLLLSYLSAFKLPFSHEQIVMLVEPKTPAAQRATVRLEREHLLDDAPADGQELLRQAGTVVPEELAKNWRAARDELVQGSFIQFDGRVYTIHAQVRHFALSYLSEEERRRIHRVMAAYYSSLPQPSPDEWFAAFEHLEGPGEPHDLQAAVHLAMRASWAMQGRGRAAELRLVLRRAEGYALQLGDKTGEGQILCCLGAILRQLGQYVESLTCLTRSLTLHREQQERDEAGWALYELAMLMREEGHFQQAGSHAQDAIGLFREVGDSNGEAWMQVTLGEVARGYGRYPEALDYFEQALANFRNLPIDEEGYAWALRNRGTVYEALGRYSEALNDFKESLRLFNTLGLRFRQAWVLADISAVYSNQGDYEQAERECKAAITIFHDQDVRRGEAWALRVMGDIARKQKKGAEASSYYEKALTIFSDLGGRSDQARVFASLGAISFDEGEYLGAQEQYEHALTIAREQGVRPVEGRALRGSGDVSRVLRRFSEARHFYEQAASIATELNTPGERCAVLRRQGMLAHAQEQYHNALNYWMQALALDRRLGHPTRQDLQQHIESLVKEHHLEEEYAMLSQEYELS
jgi:tetratricopeptide (TPR) repeat protein